VLKEINKIDFSQLSNKKILIYGFTGFIGKSIDLLLKIIGKNLNLELEITAVTRSQLANYKESNVNVKFVSSSTYFLENIDEFDFIIWGATQTDRSISTAQFKTNIKSVEGLFLDLFKSLESIKYRGKIINLSSGIVYAEAFSLKEFLSERDHLSKIETKSDLTSEMHEYRNFKLLTESFMENLSKDGAVCSNIRIFSLCGPGMPRGSNYAMSSFVNSVKKNEDIILTGNPKSLRNFAHPLDLALFIFKILSMDQMPLNINYGASTNFSILDWALNVAKIRLKDVVVEKETYNQPIRNYVPDTSLMHDIFPDHEYIFSVQEMINNTYKNS
jgi:nucleoside-diphosphate-sugar epimerase